MVNVYLGCFAALCIAGVLSSVYCMFKYWAKFRELRRLGVKGPKPSLYFGSAREYCRLGPLKFMQQLVNEYGPVCGYYYGAKPILVITDCEMIEQVLVKGFSSFNERENIVDYLKRKPAKCRGLLQAKGEAWERARRIIHPALKGKATLLPVVKDKCGTICDVFGQYARSGEAVDIYRTYGQFTMETILAVVFSHHVGILHGEEDQFTRLSKCVLRDGQAASYFGGSDSLVPVLLSNFPFLEYFVRIYYSCSKTGKASKLLTDTIIELIETRKSEACQSNYKHQDVLQTMIDGNAKQLTMEEIVAHSKNLLLAGYESMANLLAYTSYLLALNQEKQDKLYEEIESYFKANPDANSCNATDKIEYLNQVIQESLRLHPPIHVLHRQCVSDTEIGGLKIPKGLTIRIPIHCIHHSTKFWGQEPELFKPERFQDKISKHIFLPFGDGRRQCMGKMLAEMTAKLVFIETLRKYKLLVDQKTEVPLKTQCGITVSPKNGIYLKIVPRS